MASLALRPATAGEALDTIMRLAMSHDAQLWHALLGGRYHDNKSIHTTINVFDNKILLVAPAADLQREVDALCAIGGEEPWDKPWLIQGFVDPDAPRHTGTDCTVGDR